MSVGFGFSAGDFIAALELVTTVVNALRESGGSSAEYRSLVSQLNTLQTTLLRVKRLELEDNQHAELIALQQAASQCQRTIDAFWEKIKKYQTSLSIGGSGSRVKDTWRKVKWAIVKKEDLVRFKADLMGHTESIELLLTTVQMATTRIQDQRNNENNKSLVGKVQDSYFGCMQRLKTVLVAATKGVRQGKQLIEMTSSIIQTNVKIFQVVLDIQRTITTLPGQVDHHKPVYLTDALGRHTPFHLEFITCAESLISVLKINFKEVGSGASKIEKGEFALEDTVTKRDINLEQNWITCFKPGQHVAMSMVFEKKTRSPGVDNGIWDVQRCPSCQNYNWSVEDVDCVCCLTPYRREIISSLSTASTTSFNDPIKAVNESMVIFGPKRKRDDSEDLSDMHLFRRVRLRLDEAQKREFDRRAGIAGHAPSELSELASPSSPFPFSLTPSPAASPSPRRIYAADH